MNVRIALLALAAFLFGCATETEQQPASGAAAKSAPTQPRSRTSLTGSRLPPMDDQDSGSSMVNGQSGEDYQHDRNRSVSPLH